MTITDYLNGRLTMIEEAISRETLSGNAAKLDCERNAKAEVIGVLDWLRRVPQSDVINAEVSELIDKIEATASKGGILNQAVVLAALRQIRGKK
jgi:hypothetical protein